MATAPTHPLRAIRSRSTTLAGFMMPRRPTRDSRASSELNEIIGGDWAGILRCIDIDICLIGLIALGRLVVDL